MSIYTEMLTEHLPVKMYQTDLVILTETLSTRAPSREVCIAPEAIETLCT